jgi:selenobiotic family peptide radical SAM maturase
VSGCGSETSDVFAVSRRVIGADRWKKIMQAIGESIAPADMPEALAARADEFALPSFFLKLASLERKKHEVAADQTLIADAADDFELNPTLDLVELDWKLSGFFEDSEVPGQIERSREIAAIWRDPLSQKIMLKAATDEDLLALKLAGENIEIEAAINEGASFEMIARALSKAVKQGMLVGSRSMLRRDTSIYAKESLKPDFAYADSFTLQWHITNACDLHCKHCYDRSKRPHLTLEQCESILDDLQCFCRKRYVCGHVCFSGGNPLMYPYFSELYAAAAKRRLSTSILGNPTTKESLQQLLDVQKPGYFQVSLEGLEEQNDFVRGRGFFRKVLSFLDLLREMEIQSAVMLTLTKDNIDEVLPLADQLRDHADYFTFNRLCPVGEGANLLLPSEKAYAAFLDKYVKTAKENPILGYKDNLINIILDRDGQFFGGCTGHGCGAAFNFIAVLPDGEVHACRKFPSLIGSLTTQSISEIYDSPAAAFYRRGSAACDGCRLRPMCGGCMAVMYGLGKNISKDLDPYCFIG